MSVTTFQTTIENGQVRFTKDVHLPERTKVYMMVPEVELTTNGKKFDLAEMVSQMIGDYQPVEENFVEPGGRNGKCPVIIVS